jgi:hypothetical protein
MKERPFIPNEIIDSDNKYIRIKLSEKFSTIIDKSDYEKIKRIRWSISSQRDKTKPYCSGYDRKSKRKIRMSRFILGIKSDKIKVDHKNNNRLDNRRSNLRKCSLIENKYNCSTMKRNLLGIKGVSFDHRSNKFYARICYCYNKIHIGTFDNIIDAAIAYNIKAKELFKDFAFLNDIESLRNIANSER